MVEAVGVGAAASRSAFHHVHNNYRTASSILNLMLKTDRIKNVRGRQLNETVREFNGCGEAPEDAIEKPRFRCSRLKNL